MKLATSSLLCFRPSLIMDQRMPLRWRPRYSSSSSSSSTHLQYKQGQDELAFSPQEILHAIEDVESQEDDKGARTLSFVSYTKSQPLSTSSASLSKAELCSKYHIHPRNLGIIDMAQSLQIGRYNSNASAESTIVPLQRVILVNLLYVKALVTEKEVLLFSPVPRMRLPNTPRIESGLITEAGQEFDTTASDGSASRSLLMSGEESGLCMSQGEVRQGDVLHNIFGEHLQRRLSRSSEDPFEHRALESLLTSLANIFESELALLVSRTDDLVHDLAEDITREELNRLLGLRGAVGEFLGRTVGIRRAIDRLLSEDADLAAAYLTAKASATPRKTSDHEELELLLENYSQRFEGIITGVSGALARIKSNQDVVELSLASTRNKLLLLDLRLSLCTVGLTLGAFGASLLGMNLTNHFEDDPTAFYQVSVGLVALTTLVGGIGLRALRRISRAGLGSLARIGTRR